MWLSAHAVGNGAVNGGDADIDHVGGLVGYNLGTITASYAAITVDGGGGNQDRVGGLVGWNLGTITASYATGAVSGGHGSEDSVGGLAGFSDDLDGFGGTITASYATGDVDGGGGDDDRVGGLVGQNIAGAVITASYATGNATGGGGNQDRVGGLVGYQSHDNTQITASYATGASNGGAGDDDDVGRLVGNNGLGASAIASYGFGSTANGDTDAGIDRSDDTSPATGAGAVTNAAALTATNSSVAATKTWSAAVWNFGGAQNPALIWVTAFDVGTSDSNADDTYSCNAALLPTAQRCGGIIPGQNR